MVRSFIIGFMFIVTILVSWGNVSADNVSSCTVISTPGVYLLTGDIINNASTCITIESSDVTFDGQGHTIDGTGSNTGIYVYNSSITLTNVTVRNVTVTDWDYGIYYYNTENGSIIDNNANSNNWVGIYLNSSSNYNTIANNNASNNDVGIHLYSFNNYNIITNNNASNNDYGILAFSSNYNTITNNTANSNFQYGIYLYYSSSNNVTNNTASNNYHGVWLFYSNYNTLINNTASNNILGIWIFYSTNNTLTDNNANSNNWHGIALQDSDYNTLTDNNANLNSQYGIALLDSDYSTLTGNNANLNGWNGIWLKSSSNNTIYNNFFNNTNNSLFEGTIYTNDWNTTKTAGINIVGGPYLGGNFWAHPNGTGFSETCTDADRDWICDSNYTLASENVDYLPLVLPPPGIIYDPINYVITINGGGIPDCNSQNPCNFESILDSGVVPLDIYNATKSVDGKNLIFYSKARIVINSSAVFSSQNEAVIFDYNHTNNKHVLDNYGDFTLGENQSGYPSKGSMIFVNIRDVSPVINGINCRKNTKCSIYNSEITALNQRVSGANYSVARRALDIRKVTKGEFKNIIIRNWAGMATWDANNPAIVDEIDIYDCGMMPDGTVQSYHDMASWITPNRNIRTYNCGSGAQAHGYQTSTVKSYEFWIYNAQNYDLEPFNDASKPLTWKVVDFHFNASKIKIWQDVHNIQEYYTANLKVTNSTNTPLQGCNASWYITNGTYQLVYSGLTDSNGEIPQQEIINRQWSGSAMTLANYNPQRLKITCSGYNTYDKAFNLTAMSNYWYANKLKKGINWEIALG